MELRRESFAVHTYEVDAFNVLAVPALAGYLQEVAGLHADELGCGLDVLMKQGLTWVLARQRIEIPEPIVLGDALEIATWPSGIDRLAALRDFEVTRRDGTAVARATSQWFVIDLATRRPAKLDGVLDGRFPRGPGAHTVQTTPGKLPELAEWEFQRRFHIRYQDIDVNMHVNNTSYVAWALEAVPRDVWHGARLSSIEVQFLAECRYGSAILSRLARTGEGAFAHAVVREEDGKELARVVTTWRPRAG